MIKYFEWFTIVASICSVSYAGMMAWRYAKIKHAMARAVAFDKFAESINQIVILIFALSYALELFLQMPVEAAICLRLVGITATLFSSIHLDYQTRKTVAEDKDKGSEKKADR